MQRSFNEGHWGYLESRLVEIAKNAERCSMPDNKQTPRVRKLSEAQRASAESFLDNMKLILLILGVNILRSPENTAQPANAQIISSPIFHLRRQKDGIDASMQLIDGEFFLLKGSIVVASWGTNKAGTPATVNSYAAIASRHQKLVRDGSIRIDNNRGVVSRDIAFTSPSAAAAIVLGTSANGRVRWVNEEGQSYGAWEESNNS